MHRYRCLSLWLAALAWHTTTFPSAADDAAQQVPRDAAQQVPWDAAQQVPWDAAQQVPWDAARARPLGLPAKGAQGTLDIASWNLEWFGDERNGPRDETLQREHIRDVVASADMDVWGVVEVVSGSAFAALEAQLPGYTGLLANDPRVSDGPAYYRGFRNAEQKVGLLYKRGLASLQDARIVLAPSDRDFAGRPPLQVTLRVQLNGHSEDVIVIVVHAKCCSDVRSWERRERASQALKTYLDATFPTQKVWVIGDFNDDLDTSISPGQRSPYANFAADSARYAFPSLALTRARSASTVGYPDTIDHHLVSDEVSRAFLAGSAEVYRLDRYIENYGATTSDHYPVLTRYRWPAHQAPAPESPASPPSAAKLSVNEIGANEPGRDTAGEFIEIVNIGSTDADIGGYTLSDGERTRHTFATGTHLPKGQAIAVFGGITRAFADAQRAVAASTGDLNLGNRGDRVTLRNAAGTEIQTVVYTADQANSDGVSLNRSHDGDASSDFVKHSRLSRLPSSAGARSDGTRW